MELGKNRAGRQTMECMNSTHPSVKFSKCSRDAQMGKDCSTQSKFSPTSAAHNKRKVCLVSGWGIKNKAMKHFSYT
uniref:Uncharacterized protein n=1 Tax=Arundo donax TaxID=35708 RepID=A0A0A9EIY0_ARUDO